MTSVIQPTYKIVEAASALLANKFACLELTIRALIVHKAFFYILLLYYYHVYVCVEKKRQMSKLCASKALLLFEASFAK